MYPHTRTAILAGWRLDLSSHLHKPTPDPEPGPPESGVVRAADGARGGEATENECKSGPVIPMFCFWQFKYGVGGEESGATYRDEVCMLHDRGQVVD